MSNAVIIGGRKKYERKKHMIAIFLNDSVTIKVFLKITDRRIIKLSLINAYLQSRLMKIICKLSVTCGKRFREINNLLILPSFLIRYLSVFVSVVEFA